jgi:MFS family permease
MCVVAILLALSARSATPGGLALVHDPGLAFGASGVAAALAGAKGWLARRISRRQVRTRRAVIVVEWLMAGFGGVLCLLTANLDGGLLPFCAGLGGGGLSLAAAIWLNGPPARQYLVPSQVP